jgi:hypothetical protein
VRTGLSKIVAEIKDWESSLNIQVQEASREIGQWNEIFKHFMVQFRSMLKGTGLQDEIRVGMH